MKKIDELFPLEVEITQEMIDNAKLYDRDKRIGANALKAAIVNLGFEPNTFRAEWLCRTGALTIGADRITLCTKEYINLVEIKNPRKVTFVPYSYF